MIFGIDSSIQFIENKLTKFVLFFCIGEMSGFCKFACFWRVEEIPVAENHITFFCTTVTDFFLITQYLLQFWKTLSFLFHKCVIVFKSLL